MYENKDDDYDEDDDDFISLQWCKVIRFDHYISHLVGRRV